MSRRPAGDAILTIKMSKSLRCDNLVLSGPGRLLSGWILSGWYIRLSRQSPYLHRAAELKNEGVWRTSFEPGFEPIGFDFIWEIAQTLNVQLANIPSASLPISPDQFADGEWPGLQRNHNAAPDRRLNRP